MSCPLAYHKRVAMALGVPLAADKTEGHCTVLFWGKQAPGFASSCAQGQGREKDSPQGTAVVAG